MNAATALRIARDTTGKPVHLVSRRGGVPHVYVGHLTATHRVPRAGRPWCGQRARGLIGHRRDGRAPHPLRPLTAQHREDLHAGLPVTYLCRRCTARATAAHTTTPVVTRPEQLDDVTAIVGALLAVESHAETHAADRRLIAGVPGFRLEQLRRPTGVPFRGGTIHIGALLRAAHTTYPDPACSCRPRLQLVDPWAGLSLRDMKRLGDERFGITRRRFSW